MSVSLTSWLKYRFLGRQVRWSSTPISLRIFHSLLWSTQSKAFLSQWSWSRCFCGIPCFLYDPTNVDNLISGSYAFSKSNLYICKFSVHVLLKPSFKDYEQNLASMWNECNCTVVKFFFFKFWYSSLNLLWHCPSSKLEWKTDFCQSSGHCWIFQICWYIECSTLTASSFRILNSLAGTLSPPLVGS